MSRMMSRMILILAGSWIGVEAYVMLAHTATMIRPLVSGAGAL